MSIAGSDPSGGAGIQADLKTFAALGAFGTTVITALTAQATTGVTGVHTVPPAFVAEQLETLLADVAVDAVKIGMLAGADVIEVVAAALRGFESLRGISVVLDPVMVSTSGSRLLDEAALEAMRALLPLCSVVTPNVPEAAALLGRAEARDVAELHGQAEALLDAGAPRVLLKGGHLEGPSAVDVWADAAGTHELSAPRVATTNTHGTGCTLSSAIAALRPRHEEWLPAVQAAKDYLTGALRHADDLTIGSGPGPVHHAWQSRWPTRPSDEGAEPKSTDQLRAQGRAVSPTADVRGS
ncbi:phosphomethylpyrimidine kinase [Knoellia subterranea KCTC 19937]|uniref:Phosphomethylpyrimidine kinase n=1 Tax=Knoellia subterranea KCTC 19937 TaxID=1385521 RepID=A0A0A0JMC5_9MICO|nr:phosphomethylpyrimidine kinase [Knoellia subterranea KCTC 19937]